MSRPLMAITTILLLALAGCNDDHHDEAGHGHHEETADYEPGDHNGRMLRSDELTIELSIFETGVPPEFRAWATIAGKPLPPSEVDLRVRLIRLGGEDDIQFNPVGDYLRGDTVIYEPHSFAVEVKATYRGKTHAWSYDSFEGRTLIEPNVADSFGLVTEPVGPATIRQHVHAYGRVSPAEGRERSITARYEGQVKSVAVGVGDNVTKGQQLVTIESSDSLQSYSVTAPIDGVIVDRGINPGEQSNGRELLRIADHSVVWVFLEVFPRDLKRVQAGQPVILLDTEEHPIGQAKLDWLSPVRNADQSIDARVVIENKAGLFHPGQIVQGEIEVATFDVPLAVKRSGLQSFRDFTVVYGKFGNEYEVRMLELGRQGREMIEVLGGIKPGVPYVTVNSYLVKADIEKSGASHDH